MRITLSSLFQPLLFESHSCSICVETKYMWNSSNISYTISIRGNLLSNLPMFLCYPGAFCKNNCYFSFGIFRTSIIYLSTYHLFIFFHFTLFSIYSSIFWLCTSLICTLQRIQIFANCIFCLIITNFISEILLFSSVVSVWFLIEFIGWH